MKAKIIELDITTKMPQEAKMGLGVGQYELTNKRRTRLGRAGSMC